MTHKTNESKASLMLTVDRWLLATVCRQLFIFIAFGHVMEHMGLRLTNQIYQEILFECGKYVMGFNIQQNPYR
jgi:hypothetical protein